MSEKPNWDRNGTGPMLWMAGPADAVVEETFNHGPVENNLDIMHLVNEGDILVGRMQDTKELAAMYFVFDGQFIRLRDGMTGRLFETLSASVQTPEEAPA